MNRAQAEHQLNKLVAVAPRPKSLSLSRISGDSDAYCIVLGEFNKLENGEMYLKSKVQVKKYIRMLQKTKVKDKT